jgi:hypothetical protein
MSFEFSLMKAPGDKRPTWRNGVIQIHVTRTCDLSCTHCTQGSNFGGKPTIMTLENFENAVKSLRGYFGVVGVFGGNPTTHPNFRELCEILARHIPFEQRGLWSNNLRGYGTLCREIFNPAVSNLNVHCNKEAYEEMKRDWPECNPIGSYDSGHSPVYVAMDDIPELTYNQKLSLINNCDINQLWSAMICQVRGELRAFFCEIAGAQAMLTQDYNEFDTGLYVSDKWWKLPITAFEDQIRYHCFKCGVPLKGKGDLAVDGTKEYVSQTYLPIAKLKKKQSKEIVVVESLEDLDGFVDRSTDYIKNGLEPVSSGIWFPTY